MELDSGDDHENENENNDSFEASDNADESDPKEYISEVRESSLRASIRDCLAPSDILVLRTAGSKWNNTKLFGRICCLAVLSHGKRW